MKGIDSKNHISNFTQILFLNISNKFNDNIYIK